MKYLLNLKSSHNQKHLKHQYTLKQKGKEYMNYFQAFIDLLDCNGKLSNRSAIFGPYCELALSSVARILKV